MSTWVMATNVHVWMVTMETSVNNVSNVNSELIADSFRQPV